MQINIGSPALGRLVLHNLVQSCVTAHRLALVLRTQDSQQGKGSHTHKGRGAGQTRPCMPPAHTLREGGGSRGGGGGGGGGRILAP